MTFAKPTQKPEEEKLLSNFCSAHNCGNIWAVHVNGDKPKCSYHQWLNSGKAKPAPILENYPKKVKTVKAWYDEVEF
jgi:hypothetical protein